MGFRRMRKNGLLVAAAVCAIVVTGGLLLGVNGEQDDVLVSMAEAEALYGASCPGWDSNGDGCTAGCNRSCELLVNSWTWDHVQCKQMTGQCAPTGGSSGSSTGTCGSYQYVAQCE